MDSGSLDRRIRLKRRKPGENELGEPVDLWFTMATVWAHVAPVNDGERWRAGETLAAKLCRFTIRYSSTVASLDPRDRIEYDGRTWDINGVKEMKRREKLEITATARAEQP
jgi:SPP1 family predicted phage head-tail adaptor